MIRIELAPEVREDFDRILDHLTRRQGSDILTRIQEIIVAIDVLQDSPLIGRPEAGGKRELLFGRRAYGFVVLYR